MYIYTMKKRIYFTIIGIGALLAIIGFIPGGMSGLWGIVIAGGAAGLYYFNLKNEQKVQERLEDEQNSFGRGATDAADSTEESSNEDSTDEDPAE
jgi:hypothetical protein